MCVCIHTSIHMVLNVLLRKQWQHNSQRCSSTFSRSSGRHHVKVPVHDQSFYVNCMCSFVLTFSDLFVLWQLLVKRNLMSVYVYDWYILKSVCIRPH